MTESQTRDIKFFVEKHPEKLNQPRPEALKQLLNDDVCDFLETRKWGISLATIHLDEPTAKVIQEINKNYPRLPFVMWLVLPDEKGYWTNELNIQDTKHLTKNVENWINQYSLEDAIAGFGFDIEPPIDFIRETNKDGILHLAITAMKRKLNLATKNHFQKENFRQELDSLISDVKHDGIPTEAYVHPWPTGKLFSIAYSTKADYDFVMVYSSLFKGSLGEAIPKYLIGENKENEKRYPALGNFSDTKTNFDGRRLSINDEKFVSTPQELQRDILNIAKRSQKLKRDYLKRFRVFALTGKPILEATDDALKKIKNAVRV